MSTPDTDGTPPAAAASDGTPPAAAASDGTPPAAAPTDGTPPTEAPPVDSASPPTTSDPDADEEIIDAELVPEPDTAFTPPPATPAFDYTDQGVPTLDYLRDRIEKRLGTAEGSAELAGAQDAAQQQRKRDEERADKAAAKLAEIRRQVTGER